MKVLEGLSHLKKGEKEGRRVAAPKLHRSGFSYLLGENRGSIPAMHTHHHHQQNEKKRWIDNFLQPGIHKDWRTWVVIGLMLAAIGIYVVTLDDSVQSGTVPQQGVSAAAVPR